LNIFIHATAHDFLQLNGQPRNLRRLRITRKEYLMRAHSCRLALVPALGTLALSALVLSRVAPAQDASKYYTVQHPAEFKIDWGAFYRQADAKTAEVRKEFPHKLDLPYGTNVKQRLDLYFPKTKPRRAAVFLFFHGGGFREGDRAQYGYLAKPFAESGVITAVASYRLTGDGFKFPDQPADAKLAVEWLYKHIAEYGGDPNRIYVGGHSAGAILAAEIGVDRAWMDGAKIPKRAFRGIAAVSAPYDLRENGRHGEGDVYAPTAELQEQASPILHITDPVPAAVIAVGSTETYLASSRDLADKLTAAGTHARFLLLEGEDHRGSVRQMGEEDSELIKSALQMMQTAQSSTH
jgi:acetyl esterase/lipase